MFEYKFVGEEEGKSPANIYVVIIGRRMGWDMAGLTGSYFVK